MNANLDLDLAREELIRNMEELTKLSKMMGDYLTSGHLQEQTLKYQTGFVRIAFVGVTSCGKSTMINGLTGKLIVPENPNTSSPIPVWIGYRETTETQFSVVHSRKEAIEMETVNTRTFMQEYCYDDLDALDKDRSRFRDIRWSNVFTKSDILCGGRNILIDTLGIGATEVDNSKTAEVLDGGVDLVVFISGFNVLLETERNFIRDYLLGIGSRKIHKPLPLSRLYFLHNDHAGYDVLENGYKNTLRSLFDECPENPNGIKPYAKGQIEDFLNNRVFFYDGRDARLYETGTYPYVDFSPINSEHRNNPDYMRSRIQYMEAVKKIEKIETKLLAAEVEKPEEMERFKKILTEKTGSLIFGGDSVIAARIEELSTIADEIGGAAFMRISALEKKKEEINRILSGYEEVQKDFNTDSVTLNRDLSALGSRMCKTVISTSGAYSSSFQGSIGGELERHTEVPENLIKFSEFRDADGTNDRYSLIEPSVRPVIVSCLHEAVKQFIDSIWKMQTAEGQQDTPSFILEETRRYLDSQAVRLNGGVDRLRKIGVEAIGVLLPNEKTINNICNAMTTSVSTSVLEIFENMSSEKYWQDIVKGGMGDIKTHILPGIFGDFIKRNKTQEQFWEEIRNRVILPTATKLIAQSLQQIDESSVFQGLSKAYIDAAMDYQTVYAQMGASVKIAAAGLTAQDNERQREEKRRLYNEVVEKCNTIKQSLMKFCASLVA